MGAPIPERRIESNDRCGSRRRQILLGGVLVAVTLLAYIPAMRGGFFWDDQTFLVHNRMIEAPDGLRRFWLTREAKDYFPLTSSLLWVEWRLWGDHAAGYHVVNVLLHAVGAVLVWRVLRRLGAPGAWLAATLFAVHPVAAASAAWITEGKNTLSLIFFAASLLAYFEFEERAGNSEIRRLGDWESEKVGKREGEKSPDADACRHPNLPISQSPDFQVSHSSLYLFSLIFFLLALLAKTSVVMLPVVLLLCAWWRRGRVSRRDVLRSAPFFALSLALGLVTVWFQHLSDINGVLVRPEGVASRVAAAGWIAWFCLFKVLLPAGLCVIYPRWTVDGSSLVAFLPLILLAAGLIGLWARRKSWGRAPLFALACFLITLLPVLGFLGMSFMRFSLVADHLQYAAMIGVLALAAGLLARAAAAKSFAGPIGVVAAAGCVALLGILTWHRASLYGDEDRLWQDNADKNPAAWLAWYNLGGDRQSAGQDREAIRCYDQAIRSRPDYAMAYNNRAAAYMRLGLYDLAVRDCDQAIRWQPDYPLAYNNRAGALARLGRHAQALDDCDKALQYRPGWAAAYNTRGNIHLEMGRLPEAIADYDKAIQFKSNFADAYGNRALAHERMGNHAAALADAEMCLKLGDRPDPGLVH